LNHIYDIRHIKVDFNDHKLTSNGVELSIDHKAIEVLELLVNHAGETVTSDSFMEQIWHDKPSAPEVVPAAIARLRKLFKQAGVADDLIVTVHKVGYRFEPPQEPSSNQESENQSHGSKLFPVLFAITLLALLTTLFLYFRKDEINLPAVHITDDEAREIQPVSQSNVTQIYILRHTEKQDDTAEDPILSAAGIARAKYWKKVLQNIEFDQVFTTNFKRNIQTAKLISDANSIKPELYYPMSFDVLKFLNLIKNQKVLIIGHSNTIPDMVNRLINETQYPPMSHENYNILYIITIHDNGDTSSSMLHIEMPEQYLD
jgi:2,3-bisphosphoglycerate-dependent phosphoglycerate mutase